MMAPFRHADWSSGKSRPDTTLRLTDRGVYRTPVNALGHSQPNEAIDFESALTSTSDKALHRTK